jgi:hypothetical protein
MGMLFAQQPVRRGALRIVADGNPWLLSASATSGSDIMKIATW